MRATSRAGEVHNARASTFHCRCLAANGFSSLHLKLKLKECLKLLHMWDSDDKSFKIHRRSVTLRIRSAYEHLLISLLT